MEKIEALLNIFKIVFWAGCWAFVAWHISHEDKKQKGNKQMKAKKPSYTKETPVVVYDNAGLPSLMLKVENTAPSREEADPIFIVKGVEYDSIYLSRFANKIVGGRACSLPLADPTTSISMDNAIKACRAKGPEWHLLTYCEWKYIIDHAIEGLHGNTYAGCYHGDQTETGIKEHSSYKTLTGSGPASWFHNGDKETGIADVVGLIWKIVTGLRLKNGVLQYMPNNDAAAPDADLSKDSKEFVDVTVNGLPVKIGPGEDGMTITATGDVEGWDAVERRDVVVDLAEVPQILKDLGIITEDMENNEEWFAADAELDEAICFVGGGYCDTSSAGPSALDLYHERSLVCTSIGFFSACLGKPVTR